MTYDLASGLSTMQLDRHWLTVVQNPEVTLVQILPICFDQQVSCPARCSNMQR